MSLRNSHPFFKNRINKYQVSEVKTWVDMEISNTAEVDDYKNIQYPVPTDNLASSFKLRFNLNNEVALDRYNEIEGLYCENTKFNIKTRVEADLNNACEVITIKCHKCDICLGFRRLDHMTKLLNKLDYHSDIDRNDLWILRINQPDSRDLTAPKVTKRLKYLGFTDFLQHRITSNELIFLFEGDQCNLIQDLGYEDAVFYKISLDKYLSEIGLNDKYRFLGKFYARIPSVKISGISKEELEELENRKHYKNDRCRCGELEVNHIKRQVTKEELKYNIQPEDHYKKDFNRFLKDVFDYEREGQQKLSV